MNRNNTSKCETTGITYYHDMRDLTENQQKILLIRTMEWALEGGYVGGNAGMTLNEVEAFDGDVDFTEQEINRLMCCPIVREKAKQVAKTGVPVYWTGVITGLDPEHQKAYTLARAKIQEWATHCPADDVAARWVKSSHCSHCVE